MIPIQATTDFHARLDAEILRQRQAADSSRRLSATIAASAVDLNPHQIDAALFALRSPLLGLTSEEIANLIMAVNFVFIPLIVAGLTQQFCSRGDTCPQRGGSCRSDPADSGGPGPGLV